MAVTAPLAHVYEIDHDVLLSRTAYDCILTSSDLLPPALLCKAVSLIGMEILADRSDYKWVFEGAVDLLPPVLRGERRVRLLSMPSHIGYCSSVQGSSVKGNMEHQSAAQQRGR